MAMFLLYVITRLTELKEMLEFMTTVACIIIVACIAAKCLNEWTTDVQIKDEPIVPSEMSLDAYHYQGIKRVTSRGIWIFGPIFVLTMLINLVLPTTRDAVVIAGGYGMVEAVKNERVQRLFTKSAAVAGNWLNAQLNGADKPVVPAASAAPTATSPGTTTTPTPATDTKAPDTAPAAPSQVKALADQVKDRVVEKVTERVADEVLGPKKQ